MDGWKLALLDKTSVVRNAFVVILKKNASNFPIISTIEVKGNEATINLQQDEVALVFYYEQSA